LFDTAGVLIGFAKVARAIDSNKKESDPDPSGVELAKALAVIEVEVEHRRRLEEQLLTAIEQERERLGRDLHDDLSQRLAAAGITLQMTVKKLPSGTPVRTQLEKVGKSLVEAIGVARNLSRGLHPVTLTNQGLPAALEELAARVPTHVEFTWPRTERLDLKKSVALHVYRIAEEAVGNAIRHSGANKIKIALKSTSPGKGVLTIRDNGKGFRQSGAWSGMGLQNMKYRASVIGGRLTISTVLNRGTRVECTLPIRQNLTKS
jgi:signal transduction histidine kinase